MQGGVGGDVAKNTRAADEFLASFREEEDPYV